jgi:Tfp pilus assembly protein PilF
MDRKSAFFLFLLAVAVAATHGNGLFGGFVWDDEPLIVRKSGFFRDLGNIRILLSSPDTAVAERSTPYYRPLTSLSYLADQRLFGLSPFWYHLENLLFHAATVALLYFLLSGAFGDRVLAFFCALLFAVHPVSVEAVDFISARNNLLCGALLLLSLLCLRRRTAWWMLGSLFAYLLALLGKEPAVSLPFFLLSLTLLPGEERYRAGWGLLGGYFAVTAFYFLLRLKILGALTTEAGVSLSPDRLSLVASTVYEDFRLLLFPLKLNAMYTPGFVSFQAHKAVLAAGGTGLLLFLSLRKWIPGPLRAGSLWLLWGILPVSNVVLIPSAPVAERYLYIPLMGFSLLAGYAVHALYRRRAAWGIAAVVALSLALGALSFERGFVWRDNMSLYRSMIDSDPGNPDAHFNLGVEYAGSGKRDLAFRHWRETIRLNPGDAEAHNNLGNLYLNMGDFRSAETHYEKALNLKPDNSLFLYNIALAAEKMDDRNKAITYYNFCIEQAGAELEALRRRAAVFAAAASERRIRDARERLDALSAR